MTPISLPGGSVVNNLPANAGDVGSILGWEDSMEEEMATPSSILVWEIPWMHKQIWDCFYNFKENCHKDRISSVSLILGLSLFFRSWSWMNFHKKEVSKGVFDFNRVLKIQLNMELLPRYSRDGAGLWECTEESYTFSLLKKCVGQCWEAFLVCWVLLQMDKHGAVRRLRGWD